MKYAAVLLSAIVLAGALPAIADARPGGHGGGHGGGGGRGGEFGRPEMAFFGPHGGGGGRKFDRPDRPRGDPYRNRRNPYDGPPPFDVRDHPRNSLGLGWRQQQDEARQGVRQGRYVPLSRVLPELRRRSPGRQLDAGLEQGFDGRPVYRVRWGAANGRRIDYIIDAQTGQVIGVDR
jgi:hypothetical protein